MALGILWALGVMLVYLGFTAPLEGLGGRVAFIGLGAAAMFFADKLRRATLLQIEMTEEEIRDTDGRLICRLDNIKAVERGMLAFKPSNGFLLTLHEPMERAWAPGLWWRFGRKVGIGGITPGSQGKFMADLIAMKLKGHDIRFR